jgi:hypothetical protein
MNPLLIRLVAGLIVLVLASFAGWHVRGWREDAARLESERAAKDLYELTVEGWAAAMQVVAVSRAEEQQRATLDRAQFQRRLRDAQKAHRPLAGAAAAGGAVVFSPDFVGLWNAALAIGLPAAFRARGAEGGRAAADLPGVGEILDNLAANGERCNQLRARALTCKAFVEAIEAAP